MNRIQQANETDTQIWPIFRKMLFFTVLMIVCPISSYFISKNYFFEESESSPFYSVFTAVAVAHVILASIIIVAFRDSKSNDKLD